MKNIENKCVMLIDEALPLGIIGNTTAILGATIGKLLPSIVGSDVVDGTGNTHLGIVNIPISILRGDSELIRVIRKQLYKEEFDDVLAVDFSDVAQSCNEYDEFIGKISKVQSDELKYLGIAVYGSKKKINSLTGSIPLLR